MKRILILLAVIVSLRAPAQVRDEMLLNTNWATTASPDNRTYTGFEKSTFSAKTWKTVSVPHTWDDYEGYRRMLHGNRHGTAWYRKTFSLRRVIAGKRYFLFFEGVGSYANVWLNGKKAGSHAGGRTTFTIDVTPFVKVGDNLIAVRADHPANIRDLPWVCGGCSDERGFSEGSQPMGIFRPVHLVITNDVRIVPFGIHAWNDTTVSEQAARIHVQNTVKNYSARSKSVVLSTHLLDGGGNTVASSRNEAQLSPGDTQVLAGQLNVTHARLWSVADPYLYTLVTEVTENGKVIDAERIPYGIRWISWPTAKNANKQFRLNGKPLFINGIAEYEHLLGTSHAFSDAQVDARASMIKALGFNSFRDAHQPHNLRYQRHWDEDGILLWTQLSAHIWFDTPGFRKNFKRSLEEWVIERRNSPSVVLWGLQNESKLPADFARECTELIRKLDPTASAQRKVTTCNGGEGTDWDVPQNWTGTYGGDPATYGEDLKRQVLVGEYGAWRTLGLHSEGSFQQNGPYSEDRMTQLMEQKIRLADSVKDEVAGHYFWLLTSHDNPGRVQGGESYRDIDRIGPVNYKGLLTPWEQPTDAYYLFRSNFAAKQTDPMVYIVSHTWPDRWTSAGRKSGIVVYSNCDEVELFNDVNAASLGKRTRKGVGRHFLWDDVDIRYNVLYAVAYVNGKAVARDRIVLHHLPTSPNFDKLYDNTASILDPATGYYYRYRVNCGGDEYVDSKGNAWSADSHSSSWADRFNGMPEAFASQQRTADPIRGTRDWPLFQSFRYGRDQLSYAFPVSNGDYRVELYFTEPWHGAGGAADCSGWRLFDVAINGRTVATDLDVWKESGYAGALKKVFPVTVRNGRITLTFPRIAAGQAVISAIAIASQRPGSEARSHASPGINVAVVANGNASYKLRSWLDTGVPQYIGSRISISALPPALYGAYWLQAENGRGVESPITAVVPADTTDVFVAVDRKTSSLPRWLNAFEDTHTELENDHDGRHVFAVYHKRALPRERVDFSAGAGTDGADQPLIMFKKPESIDPPYDLKPMTNYKAVKTPLAGTARTATVNGKEAITLTNRGDAVDFQIAIGAADKYSLSVRYYTGSTIPLRGKLQLSAADGTLMQRSDIIFQPGRDGKWSYLPATTGTMVNAGTYRLKLSLDDTSPVTIYDLDVQ